MEGFLRQRVCEYINVFPLECDASILMTDEKPEFKEDPEEQTREVEPRSTTNAVSQPQRIPLFPGMDPSALKVRRMDLPKAALLVRL